MSRVADTLFVGFAISPDHSLKEALHPENIDIKVIMTRQFQQHPEYLEILDELKRIVQSKLGVPHVFKFRERLDEVAPPPGGYNVLNRRARLPNVQLAHGVTIPPPHTGTLTVFILLVLNLKPHQQDNKIKRITCRHSYLP